MVEKNTLTPDQDARLRERLHKGDRSAVGELYGIYFDRLYSLVFHQVDRNVSVTEDIVQETFLAALKSANGFRGESSAYTWLCSIAYHKIADYYRRQARERKRMVSGIDVDTVDDEDNPGQQPQPDTLIESAETRQVVNQALARLPLKYRQVLILKYVEEMPVNEIAQVTGRSPKAVECMLIRARKALQAELKDWTETPSQDDTDQEQ